MIEQVAGDFLRRIDFRPAYDCRGGKCQHEVKGDHGQHCVDLRFLLIGPRGATQFLLFTGWTLAHVSNQGDWRYDPSVLDERQRTWSLMPADLGYHAFEPRYEDQASMGHCDVLFPDDPSRGCYYDGSGLNAERPFWRLVSEGDEGVWAELLEYYRSLFDAEVSP